jgi:hypothetical protein
MRRFQNGERVHVSRDHRGNAIDCDGTVARLRRADDGAWIALDVRNEHCPFPADDDTRSTHIMAYPDECRPAHLVVVSSDTVLRPPGCVCTWEQGDTACPVHPTCAGCGVPVEQCECSR